MSARAGSMVVELVRGTVVESRHTVHAAVVDAGGRLVGRAGDPDFVTFLRSAAKPFQALPLVADGAAERFGLTSEDLALACASHSSAPDQVERVRAFLARAGATEAQLACGPHPPLSDAVAADYTARGVTLTAVHSNCSGKHAGMLALCRHHGWPADGYARPDHPVQRRCLAEVSRWTGVPEAAIGTGTDGCGVVCFAVPVRAMAIAYARLGHRETGNVVTAMMAHPDLVAGRGRPCTEIMTAHPGRVIAKVGAEGVYAGLLVEEGLGVALKVEDGHGVASALAMAAVLGELGLALPAGLRSRPVTSTRGEPVGALRVNGGVLR
ncbi:MAG: asparaginase [Gemmatimonadales bacterium]